MKNAYTEYVKLLDLNKSMAREYYNACVYIMDDELREQLHASLDGTCTDTYFLKLYCNLHKEKYGVHFSV